MADMRDFYYRQQVSEDELDGAFTGLETADRNALVDLDFISRDDPDPTAKATHGGVMWGWTLSLPGGMDLTVQAGAGYDESGQRVATSSALLLNCSQDGYTAIGAAGLPTGSSTDPGVGNERWLSILIAFDRKLSDGRYDGYNNLVYFARDESFKFRVKAGAIGAIGSNPARPAREANEILIDDVLVTNPAGSASIASIDTAAATRRKEFFFNYTATNVPLAPLSYDPLSIKGKGNVRDVLTALLEMINDHVGGNDYAHSGEHFAWDTDGHLWADGQAGITGTATSLSAGLWGIIDDIAATQPVGVARAGTSSVGTRAYTGSAGAQHYLSPLDLAQNDLQANLESIVLAINSRVFRGGDDTINGRLAPAINGTALGISGGNRWDAYLRDLYLNGAVGTNLTPSLTASFDLGTTGVRWQNVYVSDLIALAGSADIEGSVDVNETLTAHAAGGTDHGIKGYTAATSKSGVYGEAALGNTAGVEGLSTGALVPAVYGSTTAEAAYGVVGKYDHTSPYGNGVWGIASQYGVGVYGTSISDIGVLGYSTSGVGVAGSSFAFDSTKTIVGQWSLSAMHPEDYTVWVFAYDAAFFNWMWDVGSTNTEKITLATTDFPEGMKLLKVHVFADTVISHTITVQDLATEIDGSGKPTGTTSTTTMGYLASSTSNVHEIDCSPGYVLSHGNGGAGWSSMIVVNISVAGNPGGAHDKIRGVFFEAQQYGTTRWIGPAVP